MCLPMLAAAVPGLAGAGATAGATAAGTAAAAGGMSTLQIASLAASGLGGLASAYGQYQQSKSAQNIAERNAQIADDQAQDAARRSQEEVSRKLRQVGAIKASQRAGIAASGVELSGSPLQIITDTAMMGDLDAQTIARNGQREALGYSRQSANYRGQASAYGKQATTGLFSSLLTTGGTVADKWYKYKRS